MVGWLGRNAGYVLIFGGCLLFSTLLRSAAGPADAVRTTRVSPPGPSIGRAAPPLLIASPKGTSPLSGVLPPSEPAPAAERPVEPPSSVPAAPVAEVPADVPPAPLAAEPPPPPLPATSRIVIPRIRLDTKVVEVGVLPTGEMDTAAFAVGRLSYSVEAGEPGNTVLAGHNDIQGEVFRRLPELQVGDEIQLFRGDTLARYRVQLRTIVREDGASEAQRRENARWMEATEAPVATLISCYPYRVDTHRIIVRATLVS